MSAAETSSSYSESMLRVQWNLEVDGQVVDNVEGLCRKVLNRATASRGRKLEPADYDESLAYLLGEVVVIATERWPSRRDRYPSLGGYLSIALPTALIDHWRSYHGRDGYKRVVDASVGRQALQDAGSTDFDWSPPEPIDDRLEARTEDLVLGRIQLLELARRAPLDENESLVRCGRRATRRPAPV